MKIINKLIFYFTFIITTISTTHAATNSSSVYMPILTLEKPSGLLYGKFVNISTFIPEGFCLGNISYYHPGNWINWFITAYVPNNKHETSALIKVNVSCRANVSIQEGSLSMCGAKENFFYEKCHEHRWKQDVFYIHLKSTLQTTDKQEKDIELKNIKYNPEAHTLDITCNIATKDISYQSGITNKQELCP